LLVQSSLALDSSNLPEVSLWLRQCCDSDPDSDVRHLAVLCMKTLQRNLLLPTA
jgi:hypothetical protein